MFVHCAAAWNSLPDSLKDIVLLLSRSQSQNHLKTFISLLSILTHSAYTCCIRGRYIHLHYMYLLTYLPLMYTDR